MPFDSSMIDSGPFIKSIQCQPAIWNRNIHACKEDVQAAWEELAKSFDCTVAQVKRKWRTLRDRLRNEIKKVPRNAQGQLTVPLEEYDGSSFIHFQQMSFLCELNHNIVCC